MAFEFATGTINIGTGAVNTDYSVTGKTPATGSWKAVKLFWSGRSETTDASGETDIQPGIGVAVSSSSYWYCTAQSDHSPTTTATDRRHSQGGCVAILSIAGALAGEAKLQSFNSDGFTLRITTQFTAAVEVGYVLLGGSDITNAEAGVFALSASVGAADYHVTTFQPDYVFFGSMLHPNAPPLNNANNRLLIAAATSSAQYLLVHHSADAVGTAVCSSYCRSGEIYGIPGIPAAGLTERVSFTSFLSDGWTLNRIEGSNAARMFYLALKGGTYALGDFLSATNTTAYTEAHGMAVTPKGAMFVSANRVASTADVETASVEWSVGASDGANNYCQYVADKHNAATADCYRAVSHDNCYHNANVVGADTVTIVVEGEGKVNSFDSTNINFQMTDADPAQSFIWYVAFGNAAGPTTISAVGTISAAASMAGDGQAIWKTTGTVASAATVTSHGSTIIKSASAVTSVATVTTHGATIKKSVGTAVGTAVVAGVSTAAGLSASVGTIASIATVATHGISITKTAGTATGSASVTVHGATIKKSAGAAISAATAAAIGRAIKLAVGSVVASATAQATSKTVKAAAGAATGQATATADAQAIVKAAGTVSAQATADANGVDANSGFEEAVGTVTVSAAVTAAAKTLALAGGSSVAVSSAQAISKIIQATVGSSQSQAVAAAVGSVGTGAILIQSHFRWRNDDGGL